MGLYNRLHVRIKCEQCEQLFDIFIQFKFGSLGLFEYEIGDTIKWLKTNDIDRAKLRYVKVYGIREDDLPCSNCNSINENEEYDIFIENDVIKSIEQMADYEDYLQDSKGDFKILQLK